MGLDIKAYSRLRYIGEHDFDPALNEGEFGPYCYYENHVQARAYDFPQSFRGIPLLTSPVTAFPLWGGCYAETDDTKTHSFRAGSYSGYNAWRRHLARWFNPTDQDGQPHPDGPFAELIWFADNEGVIGPASAADLLADFRDHHDAYMASLVGDEWHVGWCTERYLDWTRAFELAADGGLVDFH